MNEPTRSSRMEVILLCLVLVSAAATRTWYLRICGQNGTVSGPLLVQGPGDESFQELVRNLSADRGYSFDDAFTRRAHPAPLYPWLLSLILRVVPDQSAMEQLARWLQVVLGSLSPVFVYLFARRAFSSVLVAAMAGFILAFDPFAIVNTSDIGDGTLATMLLSLCLYTGVRGNQDGGTLTSWSHGLALAALALTRAALLLFVFVDMIWYLRRCRDRERGWMLALVTVLGFTSGVAPWILRNYHSFHDVYPIVDSTYFHLWLGHRPGASGGDSVIVSPDELQLSDRERARIIMEEIQRNPAGAIARRIWAGLYFVFGEEWFKSSKLWREEPVDQEVQALPSWFARSYAALFSGWLLGLLLLAALGWRSSYAWRVESMPAAAAVITIPLPYILSHAEALQGPRLPLDVVLISMAAYAVANMVKRSY